MQISNLKHDFQCLLNNILSDTPLEADTQQFLSLDSEFHWQLSEDFLAEPIDNHRNSVFRGNASLLAVKDLVFTDLRSRSFVLHLGCGILNLYIWESMGSALIPQQQ